MKASIILLSIVLFLNGHLNAKVRTTILPGAHQTTEYFHLLKDRSIGIVANQTSMINNTHLVDSLKNSGFNIKCVFAPEHGFRGNKGAGEHVESAIDQSTGIKVISLYGKHMKPDANDMKGLDVVVFDIQDVGVRFYTYISTLQHVMEACIENKVQLIVLDRPNPNSFYVDGPVLEKEFQSFVGMQPVPVVYGMTIGEYASMLDGEGWLHPKKKGKCKLSIIPVKNYTHVDKYRLPVPPSPNLPNMDAVYLYPSVCFFEGTHVSLGRGTDKPFRLIGFPEYPGEEVSFKPENIPGVATNPPYRDTLVRGKDLSGEGRNVVNSRSIQLKWLIEMYSVFPDKENFFNNFFDKLAGTSKLRKQIIDNKTEDEIRESWKEDIEDFKKIRKKYLHYKDFE